MPTGRVILPAHVGDSLWKRAATAIVYQQTIGGVSYTVAIDASTSAVIAIQAMALNTDQIIINATVVYVNALGGGEIYIEQGTYNLGAQVVTTTGITIKGAGIDVTTLILQAGVFQNVIEAVGTDGVHLTNIVIRDLTVNPNWTVNPTQGVAGEPDEWDQNGIHLRYVDNALVENVRAYDCSWSGIQVYRCTYMTYAFCKVEQVHWHGLQFWSDVQHSLIIGCEVINAGNIGIVAEMTETIGTSDCRLIGNTVDTCRVGLSIHATTLCLIADNSIKNSADVAAIVNAGIRIFASTHFQVTGNIIEDSEAQGILVLDSTPAVVSSDGLIADNVIQTCVNDGIRTESAATRIIISNNHIDTCSLNGIDIAGSSEINVLGNFLYNSTRRGILIFEDATQVVVDNNFIDTAGTAGIELLGAGTDEIIIGYNRTINVPVVIIDGAGGTVRLPSKAFQFIQGTTFISADGSAKGWEINAEADMAVALGQLPLKVQQVVRLKIWAVALGAPAGAGGQMHLDILFNAGGSLEAYNLAANSWTLANFDGEEADYVNTDVIHWVVEDGDVGNELLNLLGGDSLALKVNGGTAVAPDGATNATFRVIEVEYV